MSTAPAGWHPDPTNPHGALRYWNGAAWTEHTAPHPMAGAPVASPPAAQPVAQPGGAGPAWATAAPAAPQPTYPAYSPYVAGFHTPGQQSLVQRNKFTFITLGVVFLYVVLAVAVHIVLLGIVPVLMCVRAFRAKEPFAPLAAVGALAGVAFALLALG
jgi:Protein of unknown function (DUF2510)